MFKSILAWLDPRYQGRGLNKHHVIGGAVGAAVFPFIHILLVLAAVIGGVFGGKAAYDSHFWASRHTTIVQKTPLTEKQTKVLLSLAPKELLAPAYSCFEPPASVTRMPYTWAIISSEYDYDATLLASTPCGDFDQMQPAWTHQPVYAPGPSWVRYTVLHVWDIGGSGYEATFVAQNSGHIAYLHLVNVRVHDGQVITGGTRIADSGWPGSWDYSAHSCTSFDNCGNDAHLCIVVDWLGSEWFRTLVYNPPKKPAPKPPFSRQQARIYEEYRSEHHLSLIPYQDKHHHLTWAASVWKKLNPSRMGGILHGEKWYGPKKGRQYGFLRDSYQGGAIILIPKLHAVKVVYWKHWTR